MSSTHLHIHTHAHTLYEDWKNVNASVCVYCDATRKRVILPFMRIYLAPAVRMLRAECFGLVKITQFGVGIAPPHYYKSGFNGATLKTMCVDLNQRGTRTRAKMYGM